MTAPHPGVVDEAGLRAALASCAPGEVVEVTAERLSLSEALHIERPLRLRGAGAQRPVIALAGADARLAVASGAGGGSLERVVLTGAGHRNDPLLDLAGVEGFRLDEIAISATEGSGLRATGCRDLSISGVTLQEVGLGGAEFTDCHRVAVDVMLSGIGRRARANGVGLTDVQDFILDVRAHDVSGSVVAVQRQHGICADGMLRIEAERCLRALSVVGQQAEPVADVAAFMRVCDALDCGALLCNCQRITVSLAVAADCPGPAVQMDGAFGARGCRILVETADRHPDLIRERGGSRDNRVMVVRRSNPPIESALRKRTVPEDAGGPYEVADTCCVCGWQGVFVGNPRAAREAFACRACRSSLRYRAQAQTLLHEVAEARCDSLAQLAAGPWLQTRAVFEPGVSGPLRRYLSQAGRYCQSRYHPGVPSGEQWDGLECQDLMATSFPDESFELVVSSDIFEHVRKPFAAFAEIGRILKPGGHHLFSIPLTDPMPARTVARVDTSGPEDRPLLPEIFHGDGMSGRSLVYTEFGADMLEQLDRMGLPTRAVPYRSADPVCRRVLTFLSRRPCS